MNFVLLLEVAVAFSFETVRCCSVLNININN